MQLSFDIPAPQIPALMIAFRSGMSRDKDFRSAAEAGAAVGVVAGELSLSMRMNGLRRFLTDGGKLFIDSGAFAELKTGVEPDFPRLLNLYEHLVDRPHQYPGGLAGLYVVSPDKVGDQLATLGRLTQYKERIVALIDAGCNVIVPIQCGTMPAATMLDRVADILGTRRFVAGIPSNQAAMSIAECGTLKHDRYHILGRVQMNPEQTSRLQALAGADPASVQITADANWLRSRLDVIAANDEQARAQYIKASEFEKYAFLRSPRSMAIKAAIQADTSWGR